MVTIRIEIDMNSIEDMMPGDSDDDNFVCSMENVCNIWEVGPPKTDGDLDDYPSDYGNQRDVM